MNEKQKKEFLDKVNSRKKNNQTAGEFKEKFKPAGPQEYQD